MRGFFIYQFHRRLPVMLAGLFIVALAVGLFAPVNQITAQTTNSQPSSSQLSPHLHPSGSAGLAVNDALRAATNWQQGYTLIMTRHTEFASIQEAREFVEREGGRVAIISPPVLLGWVPRKLVSSLIGKHGIEFIAHDSIDLTKLRNRDERTVEMVTFFNKVVSGALAQETAEAMLTIQGDPLGHDAFEAPPLNQVEYQKNLQKLGVSASIMGNSDSMTGTVAVCLFFVESNGNIDPNNYTWNATDEQRVFDQASSGLSWWSNQAPLYGTSVTFSVYWYRSTSTVTQTSYEPILHPSTEDSLWITQIMKHLGFTFGNHINRVFAFNTYMKGKHFANWAYSVFVGYNPPSASSTFTNGRSAYAYIGGPYSQMLYTNGNWSINNFGRVLAHESGHIFWACDEYYQPGYGGCTSCDACAPNGPRPTILNGNCQPCNSNSVDCMMKTNNYVLCPYTPQQIGWLPDAPSNLTATAVGTSQINLLWTDHSNNENGFKIERKIGVGGIYTEIATVGANVTSYFNTSLAASKTYYYRVRAYNNAGNSAYSNEANATTQMRNLALRSLATASSTNGSDTPNKAVDGSTITYWRSDSLNNSTVVWLRVDLLSFCNVSRAVIKWNGSYYAKIYLLQVSTDNVNWTTAYTDKYGNGGTDDFTFASRWARYVRVYMTQNNTSSERINEFEVYGTDAFAKEETESNDIVGLPAVFELHQNYPNPFNPSTTIRFDLPKEARVTLKVFNMLGEEVATLVEGVRPAGAHAVTFAPTKLASGTYFYVLQAGEARLVKRLTLMK